MTDFATGTTAIFANGEYEDDAYYLRRFEQAERVIAADGGFVFLHRHGLLPEVLIGDFDSLDAPLVAAAEAAGVDVMRRPTRKDQTDTELAVAEALKRGARRIELVGALGGAPDHLLGHIGVLRWLEQRGHPARIASPGLVLRVFWSPAVVAVAAPAGSRVSLVALSPTAVVTMHGFDYAVTNAPLAAESCLGLSNAVAEGAGPARLELKAGVLLAMVFDGEARLERRF